MAYENKIGTVSLVSAVDYSAGNDQYKWVVVSAANTATVAATAGVDAFGIIQDTPRANQASCIAIEGISKAVAGAAIAVGAAVTTNATGQTITAATGNRILGTALTAATAAGQIIPVKIDKNGIA